MEPQKHKSLAAWLLHISSGLSVPIEAAPQNAEEKRQEKVMEHLFLYGLAVLTVLVGGWLTAGHFLAKAQVGTALLPLNHSNETLANVISSQAQNYKLAVSYPGGSQKKFALSDMGFNVDTTATVASIRTEQTGFMQRLLWWRPIKKQLVLRVDTHALHNFLAKNITQTVQPSKDATITITNGAVKLSNATAGKEYGLKDPQVTVANLAASLSTSVKLQTLTINPALTQEQLTSSKAEIEKILDQKGTFNIGGKTVTPSKDDIAAWLELTPDEKAKKVDVDINSGKVLEYINKIAAASVHPPRDQVEVQRDDGTTAILVPGVNGVDVTAKDSIASDVTSMLLSGKGVNTELPVSFASFRTITAQAYPKWIEVDLTNKRMYAYEQTNLVKTFLVSAGAPHTPTVTGQYSIYAKYTQQDMYGLNVDGSRYYQPAVPWVNYFYKDYAIHGNYWRPLSYFGNINSSHGCVGVTPYDGEWVYDWAPIGTPVIIHT
ncbi:MAG TPA: L,D-transpeptidase family protein [Candidatus Saccharimonadales bacterium]|nr:L,D-transpeptidase family protein [Candidatus Saccharimonadales bacterium]